MDTRTSISIPEVVLLVAIAISILLPRSILPIGLLIAGGGYLFYLIVHSVRTHIFPKASFGPVTAALFIFVFGLCLLLIPDQNLFNLVTAIIATLIVQLVWVVLRNRLIGR